MDLSKALYTWANNCDERKEQLSDWLDTAIVSIATSSGKTVASTTANGLAVSFMSNSLTLEEWVTALTRALDMLNGIGIKRKATQIFR